MATLNQFLVDLRAKTKGLPAERVSQAVRRVALDALARIVDKTPVGDPGRWKHPAPKGYTGGHARQNWQVTIGAPATGAIEGLDPDGSGANARGQAAIAELPPFPIVWITNNLPYIQPLEDGHSGQAPHGMVALTIAELRATFG